MCLLDLRSGALIPMMKPPIGEPCEEEPHARFGGWGGSFFLSDSYHFAGIWTQSRVKGNPIYCGQRECCVNGDIIMEDQISPKSVFIEYS